MPYMIAVSLEMSDEPKTFVLIWKLVTLAFVLVISGNLFRQHSDG